MPPASDIGEGRRPLIRTLEETISTNDDVAALARQGAEEGLWIRAERQSGGRGRQGRLWVSPPGNLYASTLVRLQAGDPPAASLALVAAIALQDVLRSFAPGAAITIKWPNDLLAGGAKIAGILLEREDAFLVVGLGANLTNHPASAVCEATSLVAQTGQSPAAPSVLEALIERFARWLAIWRNEGLEPVRQRWLAGAHPAGTLLRARLREGVAVEGRFDGLEADGALRLRLNDGTYRVIHAADVFEA